MIERKTISVTQLIIADENVELTTVEGINYDVKNSSAEEIILNLNGKDITLESGVVAQVVDGEIAHYIGGEISTVRLNAGEVNSGKLRLTDDGDLHTSADQAVLQIGTDQAYNMKFDGNQISCFVNGQPTMLFLQGSDNKGGVQVDGMLRVYDGEVITPKVEADMVRIHSQDDVSETSTKHPLQIGRSDGYNIRIDNNEIMGLINGKLQTVWFPSGIVMSANSKAEKDFEVRGKLTATSSSNVIYGARAN